MPLLIRSTLLLALMALSSPFSVLAQNETTLSLSDESKLWVDGTSNQNDWTVYAEELSGSVTMQGDRATAVVVRVSSPKITSNKSTIMDRLMHTALKSSEHPTIVFVLSDPLPGIGSGDRTFTTEARGTLTLAGESRPLEMTVSGERLDGGRIRFTGTHELSMPDYGIAPPTAMFGALRTGANVVVHFDVVATP